jgi:GTP-binding protein HflX
MHREDLVVAAERSVLVSVQLPGSDVSPDDPFRELRALAETAGAAVAGELVQRREKPDGRTYLGKGKVQELAELVRQTGASLVIFDNDLSPSQIGNLEQDVNCKIIDRSELILDIFAGRAATHAAKLQVELAQLEYTYPRLRAMWSHLERIAGGAPVGIGTRGPGEQQLEIDRRIVQQRKRRLKRELEEIEARKMREVGARNLEHFTIGLVGYTNAGKSTLFNRLTEGGAYADSRLFSTLSTRVNRWNLGGGNVALLSDTVGFVRDLPHHLVASFRSTLEETRHAKMLFIVVDVSDPQAERHLETVHRTLDEIGASTQPRALVLNKIDRLPSERAVERWLERYPGAIAVSAATGQGVEAMRERALAQMLGGLREVMVTVPLSDSRTVDFLEKRAQVLDRRYEDATVAMRVRISRLQIDQLLAKGAQIAVDGLAPLEGVRRAWAEDAAASSRAARV